MPGLAEKVKAAYDNFKIVGAPGSRERRRR